MSLEEKLEEARRELMYLLQNPDTEDTTNIPYWEKRINNLLQKLEK